LDPEACELLLELSNVMNAKGYATRSIVTYLREMRYLFAHFNDQSPRDLVHKDLVSYLNFVKREHGVGRDKCIIFAAAASFFYSCDNRHCPNCGGLKQDQWIENRMSELLPTPYYHLVFTLPHQFNPLIIRNRKVLFNLLFEAASQTIINHGRMKNYLVPIVALLWFCIPGDSIGRFVHTCIAL
jgi:hypothetical protein